MLRDDMELYTKLSGRDGEHTLIGIIGGFLDGYDKGKEDATKWIPCSERLPEDEQIVLVTYKTTDRLRLCQYHEDGSYNPWYSFIDGRRAHNDVVVAWMPLPQPYKGKEE